MKSGANPGASPFQINYRAIIAMTVWEKLEEDLLGYLTDTVPE